LADPIKQFVIEPLFEFKPAGIDLSFTNSALWMVFAVAVSSLFFMIASRKRAMVPDRLQSAGEIMYEFVANMVRENIGSRGKQYFPFIFSLFMFVLMGNLLGLIPTSFTFTSHLVVNAILAFLIFFMVIVFGFINHGTHFFDLFAPPGVPFVLKILLVPIEILSFIIRPITLSVRLFANMMAGHLVVCRGEFCDFCFRAIG